MDDLISRKEALDKFQIICDMCGESKKNNGVMCGACYLDDAISTLEDLPSAQRWIPVSDRLPEECGTVLVTVAPFPEYFEPYVDAMYYDTEVKEFFYIGEDRNPHDCQNVTAWQMLPDPYREVE